MIKDERACKRLIWRMYRKGGRKWVEEALDVFADIAGDGGEDLSSVTVGGKSVAMLQLFDPDVLLCCLTETLDALDAENGTLDEPPEPPRSTSISMSPGGGFSPGHW